MSRRDSAGFLRETASEHGSRWGEITGQAINSSTSSADIDGASGAIRAKASASKESTLRSGCDSLHFRGRPVLRVLRQTTPKLETDTLFGTEFRQIRQVRHPPGVVLLLPEGKQEVCLTPFRQESGHEDQARRFPSLRWAALLPMLMLGILSSGCVTTSNPWAQVPDRRDLPTSSSPDPKPAIFPTAGTAAASPVLSRGQEVFWHIENVSAGPGIVKSGRSHIGPDGTIAVGPYGPCKVAGLSETQAARKVESVLKSHVKNPRVQLRASRGDDGIQHAAWRKSTQGFGEVVRASGEEPMILDPDLKPTVPAPELEFDAPPPLEAKADAPAKRSEVTWAGHRGHHKGMPAKGFPVYPDAPSELNPTLLPPYVIGPPDVLLIQSRHALVTHPIQGQHLVRPDGTVGLSVYGSPIVAGLTIEQAREVIAATISPKLKLPKDVDEKTGKITSYYDPEEQLKVVREGLVVDVLAYNSKVYYVITDGGGYGEQVVRVPVTGGETVLDAISQVNGLSPVSSKHHVWVARRTPGHGTHDSILKVDWIGVTQRGATSTNYQIMPGDRVYVKADHWRTADAFVAKVIAPFERILGVTLLGSQTVNSIRQRGNNSNGNNNFN